MGSGERKVESWRLTVDGKITRGVGRGWLTGEGKIISGTRKTFSSAVPVSIGTLRV
jgi:hypothetical protein